MCFVAGAILWVVTIVVVWAAVCTQRIRLKSAFAVVLLAILTMVGLLLFRPQENIYGGEDPGSYLNSAFTYARTQQLFHEDPMLAQAPVADRTLFLYGHHGFGITKDAVLWMRHIDPPVVGPWFQPAYPLMMSAVVTLAPDYAALWVAPLFGLLTALMLGLLAFQLTGERWAGPAAALLYVLNPVIVWNARCPRPEMAASFFVFAGLFSGVKALRERKPLWAVGAGLCLSIAPLLHITAWMPLLLFALASWLGWALGRGLFRWMLFSAAPGLLLFVGQTYFITDCYNIGRFMTPSILGVVTVGGILLCLMAECSCRAIQRRGEKWPRIALVRVAGRLAGALWVLGMVFLLFNRGGESHLPFLPAWTANYISLTDLDGVFLLIPPVVCAAALGGWLILLWGQPTTERVWMAVVLILGVCGIGWVRNFMFETRRMATLLVPFITIGLACLPFVLFRARPVIARWAALLVVVVTAGWYAYGRLPLYTTWDMRGTCGYYRELAKTMESSWAPMVFGDYTRHAAPLEHMFGLPLLSLDANRRTAEEVERAHEIWRDLIGSNDLEYAWYFSPYPNPVSRTLAFERIPTEPLHTEVLPREHKRLPDGPRDKTVQHYLYRVKPGTERTVTDFPFTRVPDRQNLGWKHFANIRVRPKKVRGHQLGVHTELNLQSQTPSREFLLFLLAPRESANLKVSVPEKGAEIKTVRLRPQWSMARITCSAPVNELQVTLDDADGLLLTDTLALAARRAWTVAVVADRPMEERTLDTEVARWARADAGMLLPMPSGDSYVLMFADVQRDECADVTLTLDASSAAQTAKPGWQWLAFKLNHAQPAGTRWIGLNINPSYNPGLAEFPDDLGILISSVTTTD